MSGAAPRVSVLMTVYNARDYVGAAVDSVLAQTYDDWELVIVDDGSTDGSRELLSRYCHPRIRVVLLPANIGRTPALRRAFDLGRGEYFAVLDADDCARADRLACQVAHLDQHPEVVLVGTWARYIDPDGCPIGAWHPPTGVADIVATFGWSNPIVHSSAMYRASVARDVGGYPLSLRYAQDCGLWLRMAERGEIAVLPQELCDQRIVPVSMTRGQRFRTAVMRDGLVLARMARHTFPLRGEAATRNRDAIMIASVKCGIGELRGGRVLRGAWMVVAALLSNPAGLLRSQAHRRQYVIGRSTVDS